MAVMRRCFTVVLPVLALLFLLSSCGEPYMQVASANQNLKRGNVQKALLRYLAAEEQTRYPGVARYNRGNSYYYLGEGERAAELWARTASSPLGEVRFRGCFNRGIVSYQEGEYEQAADLFLAALEIKPESLEAKVNLEYSFRRIEGEKERKQQQTSASVKAEKAKAGVDPFRRELLQVITENERNIWESQTEKTGTPARDW